jgi:hypothetical protein
MSPENLFVRCMAKREGELFVAVCLDFSLAAQGYSLDEAREKLHAQIADYVIQACTVDRQHAGELLTRRAPLRDRLLFSWARLRARLVAEGLAYREALPMQPACA